MFSETIDRYPIRELLRDRYGCPFPPARMHADWQRLGPERKDSISQLAAQYRDQAYAQLTAGQYMAFTQTGDRTAMEAPYFQRRRKLIAALMGACLEGGPCEDLDAVVDGIWMICEETSWVVSAHNGGEHAGVEPAPLLPLPDPQRPYVDLFAAQTAMILSMACELLSDELDDVSPLIRRRVRCEVERRVLVPFETRDDFWWMGFIRKDLCNWTPWIVSSVAMAACIWIDDGPRLAEALERGCRMVDRYLATIPDDGGCDEGVGYWNFAGGAVLDFLELLEHLLGGFRFDRDGQLRQIALFPLRMWLGGDWFVNFGDCDARPEIPGERLQYAGKRLNLPELTAFGARFRAEPAAAIADTPQLWRLMNGLMAPPKDPGEIVPPGDIWLPDLQVRVVRRGGAVLACKGGVNAGSHNHLDCGSFIYFAGGEPQIVDAGNMVYTRKTFSNARHSLWNIRSKYHNVPMIGRCEQAAGTEYRARDVACEGDGLRLDIAGAYPAVAHVRTLARNLQMDESGALTLRDGIALEAPQAVTETFLLRHRPEIREGSLTAGAIRIVPKSPMDVEIEEIPVTDARMTKSFPGSLWRAAFTAPAAREHTLEFRIEAMP